MSEHQTVCGSFEGAAEARALVSTLRLNYGEHCNLLSFAQFQAEGDKKLLKKLLRAIIFCTREESVSFLKEVNAAIEAIPVITRPMVLSGGVIIDVDVDILDEVEKREADVLKKRQERSAHEFLEQLRQESTVEGREI